MFSKASRQADDKGTLVMTKIRQAKAKLEDPAVSEVEKSHIRYKLRCLQQMIQEDQAECQNENGNSLLFGKE